MDTPNLWKSNSGQVIRTLLRRLAQLRRLFPNGLTIVTGGADNTAQQWDVATGQRIGMPLHHQNGLSRVFYSADGRTLVTTATLEATRLWDIAPRQGMPAERWSGGSLINALAMNRQECVLATGGGDRLVRLWDVASRRELGKPMPHPGILTHLLFSRTIACFARQDGTARLWDAHPGDCAASPRAAPC